MQLSVGPSIQYITIGESGLPALLAAGGAPAGLYRFQGSDETQGAALVEYRAAGMGRRVHVLWLLVLRIYSNHPTVSVRLGGGEKRARELAELAIVLITACAADSTNCVKA